MHTPDPDDSVSKPLDFEKSERKLNKMKFTQNYTKTYLLPSNFVAFSDEILTDNLKQ